MKLLCDVKSKEKNKQKNPEESYLKKCIKSFFSFLCSKLRAPLIPDVLKSWALLVSGKRLHQNNVDLQLRNLILICKWNSLKKFLSQFELLFGSLAVAIAAFFWRSAFWGAANNLHGCSGFVIHYGHFLQLPDMYKGWCWSGGRLLARTGCTEPLFCPA